MIIEFWRFHCELCGYTAEDPSFIKLIKETGICPACQNGEENGPSPVWEWCDTGVDILNQSTSLR